ncbi:MAG TPA: hypothetical protein DD628_01975 [Clostridiales bacterium]|nr:hypothetical protein [Candidatus Apopatosoma intestinale]
MQKYTIESFVRDSLDMNSPDLFNWDMVFVSSILKKEYKSDGSEKEVINGYANAVNCIANEIKIQNHSDAGVLIVRSNSLVIPFIFLCRHTVELILKYLRKQLSLQNPNKHSLRYLWGDIEKAIIESKPSEKEAVENISEYIYALEKLDPDGSHARYPKSMKGEIYHEKPKFIRVMEINAVLQKVLLPLIELFSLQGN